MKTKISICIPTFNRARLLDQALQSVAHQTEKPYEVLIVDNASTDNTQEIVSKYKKYGFRYVKNPRNIGMVKNWNECIRRSTGEYLTFLHSDDILSPNWNKKWQKIIQEHPVRFYTSNVAIIDESGKIKYAFQTFKTSRLIHQPHVIEEFWTRLSPGPPLTAFSLMHRSIFKETGFFNALSGTEADVKKCFEIMSRYDTYYLNDYLAAYRTHSTNGFEDKKKSISEDELIQRSDNYFHIIKDSYEQIKKRGVKRIFIQAPILMTIVPTNLYLLKGKWRRVREIYRSTFRYFPDFFRTIDDWKLFLKIHYIFIKRALFGSFHAKKILSNQLFPIYSE